MRKVFCFGNEYFDGDEIAKELSKKIKNSDFEFIIAQSPTEILNIEKELIILDVAKGIKKVQLLTDTSKLEYFHSTSVHDLDLSFFLKLMQETGKINDVKIIALPFGNKDYEYLKNEVEKILKKI
ncbi:MAG: hypothetical protein ACOC16_00960 [Nanoarchaeota archaeon]